LSWKIHRELMVRFLLVYLDEQARRAGGGRCLETEEQFSVRMGWPREPEGQLPF
jgi:hypothetical protein